MYPSVGVQESVREQVELQRAALEERLLLLTEVIAARVDDTLPYPDLARTVRDLLADPLV